MKTAFDIKEKVLIHGEICNITIDDKNKISYKVCIRNKDDYTYHIFSQDQITKMEENKNE